MLTIIGSRSPATILETSSDRVGSMVTKRLDSSVLERNVLVLVSFGFYHSTRSCASFWVTETMYMRKRVVVVAVFSYILLSVHSAFWMLLWFHLFTEMFNMITYIFASSGMSVFTCAFTV